MVAPQPSEDVTELHSIALTFNAATVSEAKSLRASSIDRELGRTPFFFPPPAPAPVRAGEVLLSMLPLEVIDDVESLLFFGGGSPLKVLPSSTNHATSWSSPSHSARSSSLQRSKTELPNVAMQSASRVSNGTFSIEVTKPVSPP